MDLNPRYQFEMANVTLKEVLSNTTFIKMTRNWLDDKRLSKMDILTKLLNIMKSFEN